MPRASDALLLTLAVPAAASWLRRGAADADRPGHDLKFANRTYSPVSEHLSHALIGHNASHNVSHNASYPFDPDQPPAVGRVTTLYYNSYTDQQAQTISAQSYGPADSEPDVFGDWGMLPRPKCNLRINTPVSYKSQNRKVNLRLAAIAVCDYLHGFTMDDLPQCGASSTQACQVMLNVPMPNSDEHQEPYLGAAMALAAYSKVCSMSKPEYACQIHPQESAVIAGLQHTNGGVTLKGHNVAGILNTELYDAYHLHFKKVYLAEAGRRVYEDTEFYNKQHDVLHWSHEAPEIVFCQNFACLKNSFINSNR